MKSKLLVICSSVALLHLLVGGMLFFGGCATVEEDPLPPGAYIPDAGKNAPPTNTPEEPGIPVGPTTVIVEEFPPAPPAPPAKKAAPQKTQVAVPPPAADMQKTHVIKKGDTFWSLSHLYGVSIDEIAEANSDLNPSKLRVGQKVVIPAHGKAVKNSGRKTKSAKAVKSADKTAAKKTKKTTARLVENDGKYIVRKGDSFARIAAKHHIKAADLAAANNLSLEKPLQIGQKLVIPKPGQKVVAKPAANTASTKVKKAAAAPAKAEVPAVPGADNAVPAVPAAPAAEQPAVAPSAGLEDIPAPDLGAPAAPVASPAAVDAVAKDATPAVPGTAAAGYTTEINEDTTLDALAKKFGFGVADLKKLNPEIPADGKVRAGSVIKLP